jgi:hypothetical protein
MMSGDSVVRPDNRFLLTCLASACALLAEVVLSASPILRTVIALPLVFVLPGEAALRALDLRFGPVARTPIVVGMSTAMTLVGGIVLDCLGGLTPIGWVAWLGAATVLPATLAGGGGAGDSITLPVVRVRHAIMLAATCAILVLTFLSKVHSTELYHPFDYTDFWMVPQEPGSDAYTIGIKNGEGRAELYTVRLLVDRQITGEWQDIVLAPKQSMTLPVSVPPGTAAQAWLFRAAQPNSIYRSVNVASKEENGVITGNDLGDGG